MVTFSKLGELGRFGNQLFQIAATIGYASKHVMDFSFNEWEFQSYFKNPILNNQINKFPIHKERSFHHYELPKKKDVDLYGYFQSEKYFKHCEDLIRYYFEPKKQYDKSEFVSVHVRRGDYLASGGYHPVLPLDYYRSAMGHFSDTVFVIFADDIGWCKENFKGDNIIFVNSGNDIDDFFMMSACKNNIIANSSYSWWAAWLNDQEGKKVIAPANWFGSQCKHDTKDLYLKSWIVI